MSFIVSPTRWEVDHAHALEAGAEFASTHDGELPQTPMWKMLEHRYELAPARFAFWHPNVALILERAEQSRIDAPCVAMPWREAPRIPLVACDPPSPRTASLSTAEPASLVGASICIVLLAAYWRARR